MRQQVRERLGKAWIWSKQVLQEFKFEHASLTAAAIALFGLLSLFPLVLLAISIASFALGDPQQAQARINGVLSQVLVGDAARTLSGVVAGVVQARGAAGAIGLLGFLWSASRVFTIMAEAFNMAWDQRETRGFLKRNLLAIGLVFLSFVVGTVIFLAPLAVGFLARSSGRIAELTGVTVDVSWVWPLLTALMAYLATIALFFVLYKWLPNRYVHWQSALAGAFVAGTAWEVVKYLFQLYLLNFGAYNQVYGALAGAIILVLWLYYSAMILILGVIISAVHSSRVFGDRAEHPQERGYIEPEEREAA